MTAAWCLVPWLQYFTPLLDGARAQAEGVPPLRAGQPKLQNRVHFGERVRGMVLVPRLQGRPQPV